jgi:hypothetical protein
MMLTVEQRDAINEVICWANDDGLPGTADTLRSLLAAPTAAVDDDRVAALCDGQYVAGLKAGFMLGDHGDNDGLAKAIESRSGYVAVLRATRASINDGGLNKDAIRERVLGRMLSKPERNDSPDVIGAGHLAPDTAVEVTVDTSSPSYMVGWNNGWQAARAPTPAAIAPAAHVKPESKLVTFDEFVQYGIDHGANVVNGMPWSFIFNGHAVTHETDDLYLIGTPSIEFRRGEVLVATAFGDSRLVQVLQPPAPATAPAALTARVQALFQPWPKDELGPTDEPESQYQFGYNTALEDVMDLLATNPSNSADAGEGS